MKKTANLLLILITFCLYANAQIKETTSNYQIDTSNFRGPFYIDFRHITVAEYMERLKKPTTEETSLLHNLLSLLNRPSASWIQKEELAYLITLIDNEEPAKCIKLTISSIVPDRTDTSTIGGHALDLIDAYRLKKPYPSFLTTCPKNNTVRRAEVMQWWESLL